MQDREKAWGKTGIRPPAATTLEKKAQQDSKNKILYKMKEGKVVTE